MPKDPVGEYVRLMYQLSSIWWNMWLSPHESYGHYHHLWRKL